MTLRTLAEHGHNRQARLAQMQGGMTYSGWRRLLKHATQEPVVAAFRRGRHDLPAIIEGERGTRAMVVMSRKKHVVHEYVVFEKVCAKHLWHFSQTEDRNRPVREFDRLYRHWKGNSNKNTYLLVTPQGMTRNWGGMAGFLSELIGQVTGSAHASPDYQVVGHGTLTFFSRGKVVSIHENRKSKRGNIPEVEELVDGMVKSALPLLKTMSHMQQDLEWMPGAYSRYIRQKHE